ncbi:hypothetical protein ACRAVF_19065 [Bradyrhizobium oligotrophicum S58]
MTDPAETACNILYRKTEPDARIHRAWQIGATDAVTVTWFVGDKILLERTWRGKGMHEIIPAVQEEPFASIGRDYVPHNTKVRERNIDITRVDTMRMFGLDVALVNLDGTVESVPARKWPRRTFRNVTADPHEPY